LSSAVFDASVVVKWYLPDDTAFDAAVALRRRFDGLAPGLVLTEVANALGKYVRAGRLDIDVACDVVSTLYDDLELVPDNGLIGQAQRMAAELNHTVYDCLYLVLARQRSVPIFTADKRMAVLANELKLDATLLAAAG